MSIPEPFSHALCYVHEVETLPGPTYRVSAFYSLDQVLRLGSAKDGPGHAAVLWQQHFKIEELPRALVAEQTARQAT